MTTDTVAVLMPGDMGHAVGKALADAGYDVVTCLSGRSERTRVLADAGGLRDLDSLDAVATEAFLVLSILPPASAMGLARDMATAMERSGARPVYVDCNAISPGTARDIANVIEAVGAPFIDAGIIGTKPGIGPGPGFMSPAPIRRQCKPWTERGFRSWAWDRKPAGPRPLKCATPA